MEEKIWTIAAFILLVLFWIFMSSDGIGKAMGG